MLEAVKIIRSTKNLYNLTKSQLPEVILIADASYTKDFQESKQLIEMLSPCSSEIHIATSVDNLAVKPNLKEWTVTEMPQKGWQVYVHIKDYIDVAREKERIGTKKKKVASQMSKLEAKILKPSYANRVSEEDKVRDSDK